MAYSLIPGAPLADEVRRIAHEELASATAGLRQEASRDEAIHEARKSIKKVRALLRLMRKELGAAAKSENLRLQRVARSLAELRDAAAMLEMLDSLGAGQDAAPVREALLARKQEADRAAGPVVLKAAAALQRIETRIDRWPLEGRPKALAKGLERSIRQGRKAMARARKSGADADFHEWRKRAKDHWYHVRLLGNHARREKQLDTLSELLGDDHNLAVLRGHCADAAPVLALIERRQAGLRRRALALGARLYAPKPRKLARTLAGGARFSVPLPASAGRPRTQVRRGTLKRAPRDRHA